MSHCISSLYTSRTVSSPTHIYPFSLDKTKTKHEVGLSTFTDCLGRLVSEDLCEGSPSFERVYYLRLVPLDFPYSVYFFTCELLEPR